MVKMKNLKIGLFNAGSLNTKQNEFLVSVERHDPDILAINETWLKSGQECGAPKMPGYRFLHSPRKPGQRQRGGGVGFYVRRRLNIRNSMICPSSNRIEQMWIKLTLNSLHIIVGTAYRPQWCNIDDFLDELTDTISSLSQYDQLVLVGDFNVNLLDSNDPKARQLISFFDYMSITNYVHLPTHFTSHSSTLIDLFCSDAAIVRTVVDHVNELGGHALVFGELNIKKEVCKPKIFFRRSLKDINMSQFNETLLKLDWKFILDLESVGDKVMWFNLFLNLLYDLYAPIRQVTIRNRKKPWLTSNVKYMMELRNAAHNKFKASKLDSDKKQYKMLKNLANIALNSEERAYFVKNINNNSKNSKKLWAYLKRDILPDFQANSELPAYFDNPDDINDHFQNIPGDNATNNVVRSFYDTHKFCDSNFDLTVVDEDMISKVIFGIKSNAEGSDGITADMVLLTLPHTIKIITDIINTSIRTSEFPSVWKSALVCPIPKNNNPQDLKDLRPISILPYFSKILEKVIFLQLCSYLESNNILPKYQSGFRKGRGTNTALLDVIDNLLVAQDSGRGSILVLLDYSRAFDSINIDLLLSKLNYYGLSQTARDWFKSYLSARTQQVKLQRPDGSCLRSNCTLVDRGVPQGSILGPLLFILYTSDITNCFSYCRYHLYADDVQLYLSFFPNDTVAALAQINDDLNRLAEWSRNHSLVLNPTKSKFMIIGSKKQIQVIESHSPRVSVLGGSIELMSEVQNLGVTMDSRLRFEKHVTRVVQNCLFRLKVIYNIRDFLSVDVRVNLCESLILAKLNYCLTAFGPCLLARTHRLLQRVQNACARFSFSIPPRCHVTPFLNKSEMLAMDARLKLHLAGLLFDVVQSQTPDYLYEKLTWSSTTNSYFRARSTRKILLKTPRHVTAAFRGSFRYLATSCWNNIPPPIRNSVSKRSFKQKLREHLLNNQKLGL